MNKKIISVVGARPNFMKVAPIHKAFKRIAPEIEHLICHTGQHFDEKMSKVFFDELELPKPDFFLGVSGGSHAQQTAHIILKFEEIVLQEQPNAILVVGDVNSTMACSIVASKLGIPLIHVEAGLRSFDNAMPEEINRKITDVISDVLFVSEPSGLDNLENEGIDKAKYYYVGNVMIDSLMYYLPKANKSNILIELGLKASCYTLITFHRPSNVDTKDSLIDLVSFLNKVSKLNTVVFPIHPRTKNNLIKFDLLDELSKNVLLTEPLGYIDFIALQKYAALVITDSGGIQEETTALNVQCLTVRNSTERPITVDKGTNQLIGTDFNAVLEAAGHVLNGKLKQGEIPDLWDGKAAERIVKIIIEKVL
jgi:UDP-N-acetylglucosamine 2-epimerase (non-hydrolysing)